ncbi:hypothetical protein B7Y94_04225 [Candidatus Saccharibacteria bacterium 32-49-12]|nr:MAG: hypothetical protein B7Y94_04225 [Candidatus Saccharibacteria bacterium 32-49-12]
MLRSSKSQYRRAVDRNLSQRFRLNLSIGSKLMLNNTTELTLKSIAKSLPHALIVIGRAGMDLNFAAGFLATQADCKLESVLPEKKEVIDTENGIISVDIIRRLYDSTKTVNKQPRIIALTRAETMSVQAQNAFLKLLEEPTDGVHFVLLTTEPQRLLPTIRSRSQQLELLPITRQQSQSLVASIDKVSSVKLSQLMFLIDKYRDNRSGALALINSTARLIELTLAKQSRPDLIGFLDKLSSAHEAISQNGVIRLQLSACVV